MSNGKDHEKYLKMLPQMGLTADMVPDDLRLQIYDKLGLNPNSTTEKPQQKQSEGVNAGIELRDAKTLKRIEEKRSKKRQ